MRFNDLCWFGVGLKYYLPSLPPLHLSSHLEFLGKPRHMLAFVVLGSWSRQCESEILTFVSVTPSLAWMVAQAPHSSLRMKPNPFRLLCDAPSSMWGWAFLGRWPLVCVCWQDWTQKGFLSPLAVSCKSWLKVGRRKHPRGRYLSPFMIEGFGSASKAI